MQTADYYRHARSIGPFRAVDALAMAREAAKIDEAAAARKIAPRSIVHYEVMPDGSAMVRSSLGVTVY